MESNQLRTVAFRDRRAGTQHVRVRFVDLVVRRFLGFVVTKPGLGERKSRYESQKPRLTASEYRSDGHSSSTIALDRLCGSAGWAWTASYGRVKSLLRPGGTQSGTFGASGIGLKSTVPQLTWEYSVCAPWDLNPEPAD